MIFDKAQLRSIAQMHQLIATKSHKNPIMRCMRVASDQATSQLICQSSNGVEFLITKHFIQGGAILDNPIAVDAEDLYRLLGECAADEVTLQSGTKEQIISWRKGNGVSEHKRPLYSVENIPVPDHTDWPIGGIVVDPKDWIEYIKKTKFSIKDSADATKMDHRFTMSGLCLNCLEDGLEIVSTDTRRLSYIKHVAHLSPQTISTIILPPRSVEKSQQFLLGKKSLSIAWDSNRVFFYGEDYLFGTTQLNGKYPPYNLVMPKVKECKSIKMQAGDLHSAIRELTILCQDESPTLNLDLVGEQLQMCLLDKKGGAASKSSITVDNPENNSISFALDAKNLKEGIAQMDDMVGMFWTSPIKGFLFLNGDFQYVIFPQDRDRATG